MTKPSVAEPASDRGSSSRTGLSQNRAGGLFLIVLASLALWQSSELASGTARQMGPGMVPRVLACAIGLLGVVLIWRSFLVADALFGGLAWKGPLFILGAAILFGLCIRTLGLLVAGPLAVFVSAFARGRPRWLEIVLVTLGLTLFCLVLFKVVLGLPIPVAPWLDE